jgi:hypothetical protein
MILWERKIDPCSKKDLVQGESLFTHLTISILGPAPEELIVSSRNSIGYEITKNMGGFRKTQKTSNSLPAKKKSIIPEEDSDNENVAHLL